MRILAVDTSCDDSCAAIVDTDSWKLLAEAVHTHVGAMKAFGGVVPEIASREHLKGLPLAIEEVFQRSGLGPETIDWYVVTDRPGLIGALLVGGTYVKAMAYASGKPFTALDHVEAHLYSPLLATLEGESVPPFPWIALVVSGGHTELFLVRNEKEYKWLGGTLDDAAGEAFDKVGKLLEMPYPAGPYLDRLVREGATDADRSAIDFPVARTMDFAFSFSGLKTAVATYLSKQRKPLSPEQTLRIAASAQEAIVEALVRKVTFASERFRIANIVVTGGVACNSRLRARLPGAYFPRPRHCTDNAAMVGVLAALKQRHGGLDATPWSQAPSASRD